MAFMRDWVAFGRFCNLDDAMRASGLGPRHNSIVHSPDETRSEGRMLAIALVYRRIQNAFISFPLSKFLLRCSGFGERSLAPVQRQEGSLKWPEVVLNSQGQEGVDEFEANRVCLTITSIV